jgi:hypothetical protein
MSVLLSIRDKRPAPRKVMPLTTLATEEVAAFHALRTIIEQSKLLQYLDKKELSSHGERFVCINEALVEQNYPGLDPLSGRMPGIDAFIYVYDGITSHELRRATTPGDVRQYLGEIGFRQLLLELDKACKIHRFCCEHVRSSAYISEPITKKYLYDARRDALLIHARAREVFQQIANKIRLEMEAGNLETPPVYRDAYQFSCEMKQALEPLARIGKQIRMFASA